MNVNIFDIEYNLLRYLLSGWWTDVTEAYNGFHIGELTAVIKPVSTVLLETLAKGLRICFSEIKQFSRFTVFNLVDSIDTFSTSFRLVRSRAGGVIPFPVNLKPIHLVSSIGSGQAVVNHNFDSNTRAWRRYL